MRSRHTQSIYHELAGSASFYTAHPQRQEWSTYQVSAGEAQAFLQYMPTKTGMVHLSEHWQDAFWYPYRATHRVGIGPLVGFAEKMSVDPGQFVWKIGNGLLIWTW